MKKKLSPILDQILQVRRLPGRVYSEQAAAILGIPVSGIPLLVTANLLEPLGKPAQNSVKMYAAADLEEKSKDQDWLDKATRCIDTHYRKKNKAAAQRNGQLDEQPAVAA